MVKSVQPSERLTHACHINRLRKSGLGEKVKAMRRVPFGLGLAILLVAAPLASAQAQNASADIGVVSVYAAGSLRPALTAIAHAFEARTGKHVALTFGASGLLRRRIQGGADAQILASADMGQPEALARGGGWRAPVVFARSQLCLLARNTLEVTPTTLLTTLLRPAIRIGTSTPGSDPSGDYTWQLFHKADALKPGAYATLNAKAIKLVGGSQAPKVPAGQNAVAWFFVQNRIDVFVSYCNSAHRLQREHPALKVVALPQDLAVAAAYGMTVRNDAPAAARQFAAALLAAPAQKVLRENGFSAP